MDETGVSNVNDFLLVPTAAATVICISNELEPAPGTYHVALLMHDIFDTDDQCVVAQTYPESSTTATVGV
jgi:hypothetical protein